MIRIRLGQALNRRLALRLGLGGAVIAAVLGACAYWFETERIEAGFLTQAVEAAGQLARRLPQKLGADTKPAVQAALNAFIAERRSSADDHFALGEVYDTDRNSLAEAAVAEALPIQATIDGSKHHFVPIGEEWYVKHVFAGETYLQVTTALPGKDGMAIGYFEGVYHVQRSSLEEATEAGLRTMLMVIVAVLATTALLYPVIIRLNRGLLASSLALLEANLGTLEALGSAIAKRDSDTNSHNYRVTLYAVRLAEAVGLGGDCLRSLIKGAFLHDLGKLAIPDAILLKPGRLDAGEFSVMKTHVAHGLDVVSRFDWLRDAADVVGHHHEKFDGSGYQDGLAGHDIPVTARIFAIADVFDALTSRRPYKEPMPFDRAMAIMAEGRGSHFDPQLIDAFSVVANDLYAEIGGYEDEVLEQTLRTVTLAYFSEMAGG
jgi:HD-GYP domain-containing protein (c-di-GMP phosphodiesterase class II)